jgi:Domain of unknown function (DUF4386)
MRGLLDLVEQPESAALREEDDASSSSLIRQFVVMSPLRRTALVAGVLYLLTFVSIPTLALYGPVHDPNYVIGPGPDSSVLIGGILEVIVALAGIGSAVALFPVLRRQNERSRWVWSARESWSPPASSLASRACCRSSACGRQERGPPRWSPARPWPSCMTGSFSSHRASCRP